MEDIGRQLREAREKLGLTLEEAERATRIRAHHLEALERGDLSQLPSPVQARGFMRNYADFLGLDAEGLMLRYAETVQARAGHRPAPVSDPKALQSTLPRGPGILKRWFSADLFISTLLILTMLVVVVWGGSRLLDVMRQQTEAAGASGSATVEAPTATITATLTLPPPSVAPVESSAAPVATAETTFEPLGGPINGVQIRILAEKLSWINVKVDGKPQFTGLIRIGDILEYTAQEQVEIATGNAGGVRVFYNGQDQGEMGEVGQVVIRLWTRDGMITPTATESPTPTETVTPSRTPIPSATPRPSRTPLGG